jgi:succinyl-CoA synthetase beta subunit
MEPDAILTREVLTAYGQPAASEATATQLLAILVGIWNCLKAEDATLIEINPLVVTTEGHLILGDCKMEVDDNAAFRHDWHFETAPRDQNFVVLDQGGEVATLANGAGLAMSTVDTVANAGLSVANFLDIGGGTNEETAVQALRIISRLPNVRAIIINIFAGITKSDEVARAVVSALDNFTSLPPLFIRIDGNKQAQARKILEEKGITLYDTLTECVEAVAKELRI